MKLRLHSTAIGLRLSSRLCKSIWFHYTLYLSIYLCIYCIPKPPRLTACEKLFFFSFVCSLFLIRTITFSIRLSDFCFSIRPCRRQSHSLISITAHNTSFFFVTAAATQLLLRWLLCSYFMLVVRWLPIQLTERTQRER